MACSPWNTNENSPSKSPEKPVKNMWNYHEKFHWIFMGFNFIVRAACKISLSSAPGEELAFKTCFHSVPPFSLCFPPCWRKNVNRPLYWVCKFLYRPCRLCVNTQKNSFVQILSNIHESCTHKLWKKKGANFPETLIYWEDETYKNPFNSCFVFTFPAWVVF